MSEATQRLQKILEDGHEICVRFDRGTYTVRLLSQARDGGLLSSSAMIHVQELRATRGEALVPFLDGLVAFHEEQDDA